MAMYIIHLTYSRVIFQRVSKPCNMKVSHRSGTARCNFVCTDNLRHFNKTFLIFILSLSYISYALKQYSNYVNKGHLLGRVQDRKLRYSNIHILIFIF